MATCEIQSKNTNFKIVMSDIQADKLRRFLLLWKIKRRTNLEILFDDKKAVDEHSGTIEKKGSKQAD